MTNASTIEFHENIVAGTTIAIRAGGYGTISAFFDWEEFTGTVKFYYGYIDPAVGPISLFDAPYVTVADGVLTQTTAQISVTDDTATPTYILPVLGEYLIIVITRSAGAILNLIASKVPYAVLNLAVDNTPAE